MKTCNKTAPVQGTASVTPDPIKIPGNATVEFHGSVGVNITSPTKAVLKISKKVQYICRIISFLGTGFYIFISCSCNTRGS